MSYHSIYFNGKILTVDSVFSIAQAVAIKEDRFLEVGTNRDILSSAGANLKKLILRGIQLYPDLSRPMLTRKWHH
jgi:predicted amidohydrolase YtcJ